MLDQNNITIIGNICRAFIIGLIYYSNNYINGKVLGDILCLIAALFYGIYLLVISKLGNENSLNIIFYTTLFCCMFSIVPMLIERGEMVPTSAFDWINLLLMAVLTSS